MAGNAVIGALRVVLGADTAALEKGLKGASGLLDTFANNWKKIAAGVGAAAAFGGIAEKINSTIEGMDKLSKSAQSIGLPIEELSKLKYAADLSDVGIESLSVSMGKLSKNMSAMAGGAAGPATEAFKAMGIAVTNTDGTLRQSSDVLGDIAEKFRYYEDGAAKTALAIALFGKAGAAMIPLLNQGRDGLKEAGDEAQRFGIVIDKETGAAAEAFNDNLKRMSTITQGMWTQVTARMLPALERLSEVFLENKSNSQLLGIAADGLMMAFKAAISVTLSAIVVFQRAGAEIAALWKVIQLGSTTNWLFDRAAWENLKGAFAGVSAESATTSSALANLDKTIAGFWQSGEIGTDAWSKIGVGLRSMSKEVSGAADTWLKSSAPIIQAAGAAKNALQSFMDSKAKQAAGWNAEADALGKSTVETEKAKIVAEGLQIAKANNIVVTDKLRASLEALATAYATANEKANFGKQIFEQTRTPAEQFADTMERLNLAFENGQRDPDTYARGVAMAQQQLVQASPAARALGQSLETAFGKAIEGGAKFSDILKGLLTDLAKAMANDAFRSLLYGNKGGSGFSGGGLLGGLSSLWSALPGFATGGSFQVGGSGAIDSQLVAFRATPNERVTISKPGQDIGGAVNAGPNITVNVHPMMAPGDRAWVEANVKGAVKTAVAEVDRKRAAQKSFRSDMGQ